MFEIYKHGSLVLMSRTCEHDIGTNRACRAKPLKRRESGQSSCTTSLHSLYISYRSAYRYGKDLPYICETAIGMCDIDSDFSIQCNTMGSFKAVLSM